MKEYKNLKEILLDSFDRLVPFFAALLGTIVTIIYYSINEFDSGLVYILLITFAIKIIFAISFWKSYKTIKK